MPLTNTCVGTGLTRPINPVTKVNLPLSLALCKLSHKILCNGLSIAERIYVAGISAGAALAVILGATYPDVFAAIGVHAGFEYQAATNSNAGLRAGRKGGPDPRQQGLLAYEAMGSFARVVPTIVFHGTNDYVINIINGDQVVQQWMYTDMLASKGAYNADFAAPTTTTTGRVPGGRSYVTYGWTDANSNEIQQYWKVNGMGHGWSGGNPGGSYTDPQGPNASQAIYRFFLLHSLPAVQPARADNFFLAERARPGKRCAPCQKRGMRVWAYYLFHRRLHG